MAGKPLEFEFTGNASQLEQTLNDVFVNLTKRAKDVATELSIPVKKTVQIEVKRDSSGAAKINVLEKESLGILSQIGNAISQNNKVQEGSLTSLRQQVNQAKQVRDGIAKYEQSVNSLGISVRSITPKWAEQNQRVGELSRALDIAGASTFWQQAKTGLRAQGFVNFLNGLTGITQGLQSASIVIGQVTSTFNTFVKAVSNIEQFTLTFKAINATQGETQLAFEETSRIALGLGTNLQSVRDTFQGLTPIILATGGSINDVSAITEALSSRFAAFGLSGDKARRVLNGVIQAFGKGRLQAEELTQQIAEADPAFRVDLANAIGVTSKELGELVQAGEITDKVLVEILPKLGKSALFFGRLGTSATDAANALRKGFEAGGITLEQFRNQLDSITQVNLEKVGTIFKPLIDSVKILQALFVDLGTSLANSEAFKTLSGFLNALATQFSVVAQGVGKFATVLFNIVNVVLSVVNGLDSLFERFIGFRPVVTILAALITTKLVVGLVQLSIKGAAGLAIAGIRALTVASTAFATQGLGAITRSTVGAIAGFTGITNATRAQIAADFAAVRSAQTRAAAIAQLRAIEARPGGLGGASGNVQLLAQAAGIRAVTKASAEATAATGALGAAQVTLGAKAGAAAAPVATFGSKVKGLATGIRGTIGSMLAFGGATLGVAAPLIGVGLVAAGLTFTLLEQYKTLNQGKSSLEKFKASYDGIVSRTNETIEQLKKASDSTVDFEEKINSLSVTSEKGFEFKILGLNKAKKDFEEIDKISTTAFKNAQTSVNNYSSALDASGKEGLIVAQRLAAAEQVNQEALDATRLKRDELTQAATKGGKQISQANLKELRGYQKNVAALERQRDKIQELKREAAAKEIPVNITTATGVTAIENLEGKIKNLQANIILETDPTAFAETQTKINGLAAQLAFLKGDRVKIAVDLDFNVNTDRLKSAADLSRAVIDNLGAALDLNQAINNLAVSRISGAETEKSALLEGLRERLQVEKDVRDERLEALQEAGASEAQIDSLKKQSRKADKAGATEIKGIENEIKAIQEQKRQQEAEAIRQKLAALPAQQVAEQRSLQIAQALRRLEQERLLLTQQRAETEGRIALAGLEQERRRAVDKKDFTKAEDIQKQIDLQKQLLELQGREGAALRDIISQTRIIDGLELDTLNKKQEAAGLALKAELAARGQTAALQGTAQAAQGQTAALQGTAQATAGISGSLTQISNQIRTASGLSLEEPALRAAEAYRAARVASGELNREIAFLGSPDVLDVAQEGPRSLAEGYDAAKQKVLEFKSAAESVDTSAGVLEQSTSKAATNLGEAATGASNVGDSLAEAVTQAQGLGVAAKGIEAGASPAAAIDSSLASAADQARGIASAITSLDGLSVRVNLIGTPGLWTGGPTQAGQTYQVNELGQEGFVSAGGRVAPIRKPKNALWRAPSSGTVIPAHIWSQMDVPKGGVQTTARPVATSPGNTLARVVRALQGTMTRGDSSSSAIYELSAVQARQSLEIGKLGRAINRLADKDQNIKVSVNGGGNMGYLQALNSRLG